MKKIYITRRLEDTILENLFTNYEVNMWDSADEAVPRDELLKGAEGVDGILCMLTDKIDSELLDTAGSSLKTVSTMSVGYDHIDTKALQERGVTLGYTPDVLSDSVADITIALMLNAGRKVPEASKAAIEGEWGAWSPYWMTGYDLSNSTVGLIGMGKIAEAVARRLQGFGCRILYHSRSPKPEAEAQLGVVPSDLDSLLRESDFVSIHAPLTPETEGLCSAAMFKAMKPTSVFVNTSRGGLVNQDDLHAALISNDIYAAGLDVTTPEPLPLDSPLFKLPNCLILPHIGSASVATRNKMGQIAAQNLVSGLEDQSFVYQLDL